MQNIQDIISKIGEQKFAKVPSERVGHYWGEKMTQWRKSEENRLRNQGQWRPSQKITAEQAEEIRRLHWEDDMPMIKLSEKFGIAHPNIRKILKNEKHYNPNAKYIGVKFRESRSGKPGKQTVLVNVYDENGNFIKQDYIGNLAKELGITRLGFRMIFRPERKNFHKKSKKYFFRDWETPTFV